LSNGKAVTKKSLVDEIIKLKRQNVKSYGQQRQRVSSGAYIGTSGQKGGSDSNDLTTSYIKTAGDTMIGPLAFYPKTEFVASGVLDVAESTGSYSSRIIVSGQGGSADNLVRIGGASHAGQILFLQAVNTIPITLKHYTDEGSAKGNIFIPGGSDYTVDSKEIVLLQWDTINVNPAHASSGTEYGQWTLISSSDGSSLLTSTNTWTGVNTFTGNSFSVTSPNIYLGDHSSDTVHITGGISSTGVNTFTGASVFTASTFSVTSANIFLGDSSSDTINISGVLNLNTNYEKFNSITAPSHTTANQRYLFQDSSDNHLKIRTNTGLIDLETSGGASLSANNTWTGGNAFNGSYVTVAGTFSASGAAFTIGNASSDQLYINSTMQTTLDMGDNKITDLATPTSNYDAATKKYVDDNSSGGGVSLSGTNTWTGVNTFTANSFSVTSTNIYLGDHSSDNVYINGTVSGTLRMGNNDIDDIDNLNVDGTANFNNIVNLGDGSNDDINLKGKLDVINNTGTASYNFYSLYSQGYITIKVGGVNKRLYYFAG
jgi:hypothetical protein